MKVSIIGGGGLVGSCAAFALQCGGVVSGIDPSGNPIIISGNHGHKVGEGVYPRSRVYAYVMP